jgi:uncharacterized protein (TIGR02588 family)
MSDRRERISPWDWVAASIAAAMVVSMVVTLFIAGRRERTPPRFAIAIESIAALGPDFLVQFSISNEGSETGAQVIVEGEVESAGEAPEKSSVSFDYVPGGSTRRGGVLFRHDPRAGRLTLRPLGYRQP